MNQTEYQSYNFNGIFFTGLKNAVVQQVSDSVTGNVEYVIGVHQNSMLITQHKTSAQGINCTQWFDMDKNIKGIFINKNRFGL